MSLHRTSRRTPAAGSPVRRGMTVIELTVAVMLLAAVFAMLGPTLTWVRQQRRVADDRQLALLELANLGERLSLRTYDELTPELLGQVTLPEEAAAELDAATLSASIADEAEPVAKRITLELAWSEDGVRPVAPLRLVLWRFPDEEGAP